MEKIIVALFLIISCFSVDVSSSRRHNAQNYYKYSPQQQFYFSNIFKQDEGDSSDDDTEGTISVGLPDDTKAPSGADSAKCSSAGFFKESCTQYKWCTNITADGGPPFTSFIFDCPAGTVFNTKINICDHEFNAYPDCQGQSITPVASGDYDNSKDKNGYQDSDEKEDDRDEKQDDSDEKQDDSDEKQDDSDEKVDDSGENDDKSDEKDDDSDEKDDDSDEKDDSKEDDSDEREKVEPGVFSLICYDDYKYKQHPLYCNIYFICQKNKNNVWTVPSFQCPPDLIFDEAGQSCRLPGRADEHCETAPNNPVDDDEAIPEGIPTTTVTNEEESSEEDLSSSTEVDADEDAQPTNTEMIEDGFDVIGIEEVAVVGAASPSNEDTNEEGNEETVDGENPEEVANRRSSQNLAVEEDSLYACPATGFYPYEKDCIRFYRCVVTKKNSLTGLFYRCPQGYGFSEEEQTCITARKMKRCTRIPDPSYFSRPSYTPRYASATPLSEDDLLWFFHN